MLTLESILFKEATTVQRQERRKPIVACRNFRKHLRMVGLETETLAVSDPEAGAIKRPLRNGH
jgi:hypothetical protein